MRNDGRNPDQIRKATITRNYLKFPEGSVLIEMGDTKVICTASVEESVPQFKKGSGSGWVTAEYGMLPRSTTTRMPRDAAKGKVNGRAQEIQRLIGRCLRSVVNMDLLGERTIFIDTDVIQADGGTRTASITGAFVALNDAVRNIIGRGLIRTNPIKENLAAISVGVVNGKPMVDLNYEEDSSAHVDMNIVMTESGKFVEVQGTAEGDTFSKEAMSTMIALAEKGIKDLIALQKKALS